MICNKCGAQIPDGSQFCDQCGSPLDAVPQQSQPVGQPAFQQPTYVQPQQPMGGQPAYGQQFAPPQQARVRVPLDPKKKKLIIIIGACAAVLVAFIIVLFAAIIPNSGVKGKLRHRWQGEYGRNGYIAVVDLKSKQMSIDNQVQVINSWKIDGNHLQMTATYNMQPSTADFYFLLSSDGKYLLLYENSSYNPLVPTVDTPSALFNRFDNRPTFVLARMD